MTVKVDEMLSIIADEVGVSADELTEDVELADIGIDDLLSKSITSRIAEEMKISLPSTTLMDFDSTDSLRDHLETMLKNSTASTSKRNPTTTKKTAEIAPKMPVTKRSAFCRYRPRRCHSCFKASQHLRKRPSSCSPMEVDQAWHTPCSLRSTPRSV